MNQGFVRSCHSKTSANTSKVTLVLGRWKRIIEYWQLLGSPTAQRLGSAARTFYVACSIEVLSLCQLVSHLSPLAFFGVGMFQIPAAMRTNERRRGESSQNVSLKQLQDVCQTVQS